MPEADAPRRIRVICRNASLHPPPAPRVVLSFPPSGKGLLPLIAVLALLTACAPESAVPPASGDLKSARVACNEQYPRRVGSYLPHAQCVNGAIERFAIPTAHYPDLVRLQGRIRERLSERIDKKLITAASGERRMREADTLVAQAERDRDAGHEDAASRKTAALEMMLR
jgi:hypothetical protein